MIADLHIHTSASDGRLSPLKIVEHALEAGLSYIAITDHDTVDAHIEIRNESIYKAFISKLSIIPGIEFSTDLPEHEVHILGYFIDIENSRLNEQLEIIRNDRIRRSKKMVDKLNKLGFSIDYNKIVEIASGSKSIGRPHVAKALVESGYFSTVSEAFEKVLANNGPAYVPHYKLAPEQVVELIKLAGGIPVLAHPGLVGDDNIVLNLIKAGIQGLEVYHPEHNQIMTNKYLNMAKDHHLKITGGSDFHAIPSRYPEKLGIFTIPANIVEYLSR